MNKSVIILITAVLIVAYAGDKITKIKAKEHYSEFNSANLNGELEMFGIAYRGISIKLKGSTLEYIFYPSIDLKEKRIFDH